MSYHPTTEMLADYASGAIDACNGLAIAAHLEICPRCRAMVEKMEQELSEQQLTLTEPSYGTQVSDFDDMLAAITALPVDMTPVPEVQEAVIEVNGRSFVLPKALSRLSGQINGWNSYGGKVYSAQFDVDEPARMNLLYISKGVTVPQHTHKGIESTLVLHGSFSDENGRYISGDFIVADSEVKHAPSTPADEDCLCLTVLTQPMIFTQGVARIFNMFGRGMYP
jgi:putative transcriptional regulator